MDILFLPKLINKCRFKWRCTCYNSHSVYSVGTRYFIRGLDIEGNAANYVETEQIVQFESGACSFVQASVLSLSFLVVVLVMKM